MWLIVFGFIAALAIWFGILWLLLPVDIFDYSLPTIIAMHLVPPLVFLAIQLLITYWRRKKKLADIRLAETARENLRETEKAKNKAALDAELAQRRIGIDCRWVAVADMISHTDADKIPNDVAQSITRFFSPQETMPRDWPLESVTQLLGELFDSQPLASCLPFAICGPTQQTADQTERIIRQAYRRAQQQSVIQAPRQNLFEIRQISVSGISIYDELIDIFAQNPAWPGIVLIAFDSPWQYRSEDEDQLYAIGSDELTDTEKWLGKPGRAISMLLLTPQNLSAVLKKLETLGDGVVLDHMTPFWERQQVPLGMASFLMQLPQTWRGQLEQMPPIATLHRPSRIEINSKSPFGLRTEIIRTAIRSAAINARLLEPAVEFDGEVEPPHPSATPLKDCSWLIHNAGNISCSGGRLAILLSALWQENVELELDQMTNTVMTMGDCGGASRWSWLALGVQRTAASNTPTACAEFSGDSVLNSYFLSPPTTV